jgi:Protein of unknown function (DUF3108)
MWRWYVAFIGFSLPCATCAQPVASAPAPSVVSPSVVPPAVVPPSVPGQSLHASYETYAAGLHVAEVDSGFSFGPWNYQMDLGYHTTGMVGLFFRGHQFDRVTGSWHDRRAAPSEFVGQGTWRGVDRLAVIEYRQGKPVISQLLPPNADEREPVPDALQEHSIDTLSALAELIHVVAETGRCETTVRTYDGRRAVEIVAHTAGEEMLEKNNRSSFSGKTLRCDFSGRMLAGFKFDDDRARDSKPMHGSAWLAAVVAGEPPLPVRMAFETRWFGDAIMYLTKIGPETEPKVARGDGPGRD